MKNMKTGKQDGSDERNELTRQDIHTRIRELITECSGEDDPLSFEDILAGLEKFLREQGGYLESHAHITAERCMREDALHDWRNPVQLGRSSHKMPEYQSTLTAGGRSAVLLQNPLRALHATQRQNLIGMTVDRSGSMNHLSDVAVRSLNELIEQQKQIAVDCRFILSLFNDRISTIHDGIPLREVPLLTRTQYDAGGGTALNDAIAHLIRTPLLSRSWPGPQGPLCHSD
jgi:hypothetical protein